MSKTKTTPAVRLPPVFVAFHKTTGVLAASAPTWANLREALNASGHKATDFHLIPMAKADFMRWRGGRTLRFPVRRRGTTAVEFTVPWSVVEPFEHRAFKLWGRTLSELASGNGLSFVDLWRLVHGGDPDSEAAAETWCRQLVSAETEQLLQHATAGLLEAEEEIARLMQVGLLLEEQVRLLREKADEPA